MQRFYDPRHGRLVYALAEATPEFWDARWRLSDEELRRTLASPPASFTVPVTRRYLAPGRGAVLEGGCGRALHVAALRRAGYACTGVDTAAETVAAVRRVAPDLDVRQGDVRSLPFADGSFAAYWSIGVIEHFYDGYDAILDEAARVLAPGGIFFLVFPYLSPARKVRARLGGFPVCTDRPDDFYQFALDPRRVGEDVAGRGFVLLEQRPRAAVHGLYEELGRFGRVLDPLRTSKHPAMRVARALTSRVLGPVFGHSLLQVYRRRSP